MNKNEVTLALLKVPAKKKKTRTEFNAIGGNEKEHRWNFVEDQI